MIQREVRWKWEFGYGMGEGMDCFFFLLFCSARSIVSGHEPSDNPVKRGIWLLLAKRDLQLMCVMTKVIVCVHVCVYVPS